MAETTRIPHEIEVYQILDDLRGCFCLPPGIVGRVHRVLDAMKSEKWSRDQISKLEQLSILLHRIRTGLDSRANARSTLDQIVSDWLTVGIPNLSMDEQCKLDHAWLSRVDSQLPKSSGASR